MKRKPQTDNPTVGGLVSVMFPYIFGWSFSNASLLALAV